MDKKPIKRNEHIVKLSRDHHASLMFCWKLRQGAKHKVDLARMANYVRYFWQEHMQPHFQEEEEILFAPLKDDLVQRAIDEHQIIKTAINHLEDQNAIGDDYLKLADLVDGHVRYEERTLFPHLEVLLTDDQLENIGQQLPDYCPKDNYEDDFWVAKK